MGNRRTLNIQNTAVTVPRSAMPDTSYLQVTVLSMSSMPYSIVAGQGEGVVKSNMVRVHIEQNDNTLANIGTRVKSQQLAMANLVDPIQIEIPFSGSIGEINTLSCGFTVSDGDTIDLTGITTEILSNSVI